MSKKQATRKPRTYRYASKVSSTAHDAVNGASLLLGFARSTVRSTARGAKNSVLNAKAGFKDGWKASS
mgnify:CR=1 FL=1